MGDKAKLTKARTQLEELYSGIPDESVDLTFQHLANVKQNAAAISPEKRKTINAIMEAIPEVDKVQGDITPMRKLPSLDFSKGLQATNTFNHSLDGGSSGLVPVASRGVQLSTTHTSPLSQSGFRQAVENSMAYGDVSMASNSMYHHHQDHRGGVRRRPGIPNSNICTICSTSILMFKHRCLVCGRVYCRGCVGIGMGEMTEGRKCIDCLGRRFSQRYIQRAGESGCFCSRYPSKVRQAELKWAEKGPRRNGERGFDPTIQMTPSRAHSPRSPMTLGRAHPSRSPMIPSRSQAPMTPSWAHYSSRSPMTPSRPNSGGSNPNSFVTSGSYSPYSPANHHYLPF